VHNNNSWSLVGAHGRHDDNNRDNDDDDGDDGDDNDDNNNGQSKCCGYCVLGIRRDVSFKIFFFIEIFWKFSASYIENFQWLEFTVFVINNNNNNDKNCDISDSDNW